MDNVNTEQLIAFMQTKLLRLLPLGVCTRKTVNQLHNTPHSDTKTAGAWHITLNIGTEDDPKNWLVLCWPQLLKRLLGNMRIKAQLEGMGIRTDNLQPTDFDYIWLRLEQHFKKIYCLPGSVFNSHVYPFNKLTQHIPACDNTNEHAVTIVRLVDLNTEAGQPKTARRAVVLNDLNRISDSTYKRCPTLFRLLSVALRRSALQSCLDPFREWGVAWVSNHLYFHYGRALHTLQLSEQYTDGFGSDFEDQMVEWSEPSKYPRVTGVSKRLLLQSSMLDESLKQRQATNPLKALYADWDEVQYFSEYHDGNCAVFNTDKLCDFVQELILVSENPELLRASRPKSDSERKKIAPLQARICLDAINFGATESAPITLNAIKIADEVYWALPEELPEMTTYLVQRYAKMRSVLKLPDVNGDMQARYITRDKLPRHKRSFFTVAGRLFFNAQLLLPQGELIKFIRIIYERRLSKEALLTKYVEAYENFLQWVIDPKPLLDNYNFTGELRTVVIDEEPDCPVRLKTKQERIDYIFTKGLNALRGDLSYVKEHNTTKVRSPRLNDFDKYAIWQVCDKELPALGKILTIKQQAQYIAWRWLPWHRPANLAAKLGKRHPGMALSAPKLERTDEAMAEHIKQAEAIFGSAS